MTTGWWPATDATENKPGQEEGTGTGLTPRKVDAFLVNQL